MMERRGAAPLQQVHVGLDPGGYEPVALCQPEQSVYAREHDAVRASLLRQCPGRQWPEGSCDSACPRPILVGKHHQRQLAELHDALSAAITDMVQRWWTDSKARLPERMPLERREEELLRWLEDQVSRGNLAPYPECQGSWRPDFLVEDCDEGGGVTVERFRITEINARFSFNGLMHEAHGQQTLDDMDLGAHGLVSATNVEELLGGLLSLFKPGLPLHLLKGDERGYDIHIVMDYLQRRVGVTARLVKPADLRLLPDARSKGGYRLCCVVGSHGSGAETVEEVHQVGLELHQRELVALEPEMLRQVSLRCFNDMRTVLLVHDKRMLGLVREELPSLQARRVLTAAQARVLDRGIVETMLPATPQLRQVLRLTRTAPRLKNSFLLKPVRGGKGAGIVFGEDVDAGAWLAALERQARPGSEPGASCVVQRRIVPRLYDVVLGPSGDRARNPLVGTYHAVHGRLLGLGVWRSSGGRICAVSRGGAWMCSVMGRE